MARKLVVAVIFGGRSCEHEVSLESGRSVMEQLGRDKYTILPIGITPDGRWLCGGDPLGLLRDGAACNHPGSAVAAVLSGRAGIVTLHEEGADVASTPLEPIDVAFPVLHGPYGEDGTIQGLLELADIPCVGAGVAASAIAMDKCAMKLAFRAAGLPVVPYMEVRRSRWEADRQVVLEEVSERIGCPCFVKPANLGSSVGVSKVTSPEALPAALDVACRYDRKVMVEWAVDARELECGILGNDHAAASVVGEIIPGKEFYDYEAKYTEGLVDIVIPAHIPPALAKEVQAVALRAFASVDCAGMARVDFFLDRASGKLYLSEINTIPGFTSMSVYPRLWQASGVSYPELLDRLIELSLERHRDKKRTETRLRIPHAPGE